MALRFREKLERYPPLVCRILARKTVNKRTVAIRTSEIVHESGLSFERVMEISRMMEWDTVPVGEMYMFMRGCNVDIETRDGQRFQYDYSRKMSRIPQYVIKSPEFQKVYVPLLQQLKT